MSYYNYNYELGNQLKKLRNASGISQEKVAEMMDLQPRTIGDWERGVLCRRVNDFHRLLDIYKVSDETRIDLVLLAYGNRK